MNTLDTDYLVIGSGAVGLAFADTLLQESDAHITIVDRHGKPGGHWNDAYPFVSLHQPSAFYGVNSLPLGSNRKDTIGVNQGLYELASGPEVSGYFDSVMRQRLLPSGRVSYHPMCDYLGDGRFVSMLSGEETQVRVARKTVDATYFGTSVPATHTPRYQLASGVNLVPPNALPQLWMKPAAERPRRFVIVGAGKTAMDVGVWLLNTGAAPDSVYWVMPRDSWLLNRQRIQPGMDFFHETLGAMAEQMVAFAQATSVDDLFERLEAAGIMLRIDRSLRPGMFHYATMSTGEIEVLRRITQVIRMGRVQAIDSQGLVLDQGRVDMDAGTLYIDCTASAVEPRPVSPIFQGARIVPQLVRAPQPAFSAALIAYVEAHYEDDAAKNALCGTVPFPHKLHQYLHCNMANMANQYRWGQDKVLSRWIRDCRLDGFGKVIAAVSPDDTEKLAVLERMRAAAGPAMANLQKLAAQPA
ncbi:NAD(P)-binding protein [Polaromonas sp.]|uniref:NAD(P)-binding protein n=1 Tax=Polaromonas sp. TaxID=1869339 RepID=UPI0027317593|nr:NAD(P)-binding protein [Polaromonas sp.]MDP1742036.1 NAD(P)-binding protein [Polaromonas sp.]